MSLQYQPLVDTVLQQFCEQLESNQQASLQDTDVQRLKLLIDAAITEAVNHQLEAVADRVADLSVLIRRRNDLSFEGADAA